MCCLFAHRQHQTISALEAKVTRLSEESEQANIRHVKLLQEKVGDIHMLFFSSLV